MNNIIWELAHLAHFELLTPKLEESVNFFTEFLGMSITERKGDSVYLRAYDDYEHHTLKLTAHKHSGIGHFAWRTRSQEALEARVKAIKATGLGIGWVDHECGYGKAYKFKWSILLTFMPRQGNLLYVFFNADLYFPSALYLCVSK